MYARIVGTTGLIVIAILFTSECRSLRNSPPLLMGETEKITGLVKEIRVSARFKEAVIEIRYEYAYDDEKYYGSAVKGSHLRRAKVGDSLLIEVSKRFPSRSYAIATYPLVGEF